VICMNCGFNRAEGSKIQTRIDTAADEPPNPVGQTPDNKNRPAGSAEADLQDGRLRRALSRTAAEEEAAAEIARKHRFQENILPIIFIVAGLLLAVFNAFVMQPWMESAIAAAIGVPQVGGGITSVTIDHSQAALTYFSNAGQLLLVQIPCLFAGLLVCAALLDSAFGTISSVLKKLLALALLAGSFYFTVDLSVNILMTGFGGLGWIFTFSIALAFFWIVITTLFDDLELIEIQGLFIAMVIAPSLILFVIDVVTASR